MTELTSISIAACGLVLSCVTFIAGRLSVARNSGQEYGIMMTQIEYIKNSVDDLREKLEQFDRRYIDLTERVTALEKAMKIYHGGNSHGTSNPL